MITATHSELITSHDDAIDFLKSCAPGARIEVTRIPNEGEGVRQYRIWTVLNGAREYLAHMSIYGLPFHVGTMRDSITKALSKRSG